MFTTRGRKALLVFLFMHLVGVINLAAQAAKDDLDERYRYPLSFGLSYGALMSLQSDLADYASYGLSAVFRLPLARYPAFQPGLRLGYDTLNAPESQAAWSHSDYGALLTVAYAHRLSKSLEVALELGAGASLSTFPKLIEEIGTMANPNAIFQASAKIALSPAFNFALELEPVLRYQKSVGALSDFDGFTLGIGLTAHIRLGEDPDSAQASLRSLRFGELSFPPVFPAMQSWYLDNSLAKLTITNEGNFPLSDVQVSFFQKGFMDAPSPCVSIPLLKAGESREVGIKAAFNQEVFRSEGVTPLSGEIIVNYRGRGRDGEQRLTVPYKLQDKSAIVWDDDRKVAAFITGSDGALRNYASFIRQSCKGQANPGYSPSLQFAAQLFYALGELGIIYQSDPLQPFGSSGDGTAIDSVSLPRDTLKRITGDCDDLTVLFASLLESAGYESGFITVPGHIFAAVNSGLPARNYADLDPDRSMTINVNGQLWVPIEITMIGRSGFLDAWRRGAEEWLASESDAQRRGFYPTAQAQAVYRPVGLRETDLGLQYGRAEKLAEAFSREIKKQVETVIAAYQASLSQGTKEELNALGVRLARFGYVDRAVSTLQKALAMDASFANPRLNLGNCYMLNSQYDKALAEFRAAEASLLKTAQGTEQGKRLAGLRLSAARCLSALGKADEAKAWVAKASEADKDFTAASLAVAEASKQEGQGGSKAQAAVDELYFAE